MMVEASMVVMGNGVTHFPDLLQSRLPEAVRRSLDDRQVLIIEHSPRWFGCASITIIICSVIEEAVVRLSFFRGGGWCPSLARTDRARLRPLSDVLAHVAEICDERGWIRDDVGFLW